MSNTARIETNNCIVWTRVSTKYQEENGLPTHSMRGVCEGTRSDYQGLLRRQARECQDPGGTYQEYA